MANPYEAFREFERMLFAGVPERPESMFQRNDHDSISGRETLRSLVANGPNSVSLKGARLLGTVTYDSVAGTARFRRARKKTTKRKIVAR